MSSTGALLFGRRTYEDFYSVWPKRTDGSPFTSVLNNSRKYVASKTLKEPLPWVNSMLLKGYAAEAVATMKAQPGKASVVLGSGVLLQTLMQADLVDEYVLLIHPLLLASGRRLFADRSQFAALRLIDAKLTTTGVVIATYCCHPALAQGVQVALRLRLLGGLTTAEIARAFLVPEATMAQRLVRAKNKIRDARIPYRGPNEADLPGRIRAVLAVVYLIFNEGYAASSGDPLVREDLCTEAVRLGRLLVRLTPEPEVMGLLALMLLVQSRRAARTTSDGSLVLLADQDRDAWDRELVAEGQAIVRQCLEGDEPGPYQLQAAINAVHSDATDVATTDWWQILQLYNQLMALAPSPVVALNRAVAVAEVEGPDAALTVVDGLEIDGYYLFHAIRADLLKRLGRNREAASAYQAAIVRAENAAERDFLERSRQALLGQKEGNHV